MSRKRNFTFTCNNYTVAQEEQIRGLTFKYLVYGYEIAPTTGTPHLQGTIVFRDGKSLSAVKRLLPGCHVEICRRIHSSIEYCKKCEGFYEAGVPPVAPEDKTQALLERRREQAALIMSNNLPDLVTQGEVAISQLPLLAKAKMIMLMNLPPYVHDDFSRLRGEWYCGPSRTGKSRTASEKYPQAYRKACNKWWCGYSGQDAVIIDDLDTHVLGHYLKIWADVYAALGETKNGQVQLVYKTIIVTSNYTIEELFASTPIMIDPIKNRFHVTHFRVPL